MSKEDVFLHTIPVYEHINKYRGRYGLPPYPEKHCEHCKYANGEHGLSCEARNAPLIPRECECAACHLGNGNHAEWCTAHDILRLGDEGPVT